MSRYDDYDAPTRAECEAEAFEDRVREGLADEWEETPEGQCLARLLEEHPHLTKTRAWLEDKREDWIEEWFDDAASGLAEEEAYRRDPYAYYGCSRSDF